MTSCSKTSDIFPSTTHYRSVQLHDITALCIPSSNNGMSVTTQLRKHLSPRPRLEFWWRPSQTSGVKTPTHSTAALFNYYKLTQNLPYTTTSSPYYENYNTIDLVYTLNSLLYYHSNKLPSHLNIFTNKTIKSIQQTPILL